MLPVLLPKLEDLTGVTPDAFNGLIKRGLVQEGVHWFKAPNGRIFADPEAFAQWVKSSYTQATQHNTTGCRATSKSSTSKSPQPLT